MLRPLWKGIRTHRGKGLAAFLKAIGFVIPLMDATYANYYTREVMVILIREFQVGGLVWSLGGYRDPGWGPFLSLVYVCVFRSFLLYTCLHFRVLLTYVRRSDRFVLTRLARILCVGL